MITRNAGETTEAFKIRAAADYKKTRSENGRPVLNDDDTDLMEYLMKLMGGTETFRNQRGQSGQIFPMRFIEPGLVHYDEVGTVLVTKEALDKMSASFTGKPIFNESHKDVSKTDFKNGKADGVMGRVWFDQADGWFWADAIIWDEETVENIRNGYSLSCAYDVPATAWGPGGVHNNIPYDREVMNGEYTHLAIVPNPRYERARIIYNQGGRMKLKFWPFAQGKTGETPSEVELTNATVALGDKEVPVSELIASFEAQELANAKKTLTDDDTVEVAGKKVTVKELKAAHAAQLKNAEDEKAKKAKEKEDMENESDEDKKKREDEERRNAEDEEKKKKDEEVKNALDKKHFEDIRNAANARSGEFHAPNITSTADRVAEGSKRYGTK